MSEIVTIGASRNLDVLGQKIMREIGALTGEGWKIELVKSFDGKNHQLQCLIEEVPEDEKSEEIALILQQYTARQITEWILDDWEKALLNKYLKTKYYYFSESEKKNITDKARKILQQEEETSKDYIIYRVGRNERILERLLDVMILNKEVHIDGFIRFRLKDYVKSLCEAVDLAVDEYMMEKEYNEFVRLLKYFLEIQDTRIPLIHVFLRSGGQFYLVDNAGNPVSQDLMEGLQEEEVDQYISHDDLLISSLITVAPEQVLIHAPESEQSSEALNTIKAVFGDRLHYCPGCERCMTAIKGREREVWVVNPST
ncbi:putative sporulation protein YtxC [Heliorestis acidaminivorans]|uniref:putative sporulation protein YtxC n=1 Tax=Heliorestis acidaminivorans TaxID=553427 RepID=UPI0014794C2A|nr:putative sporulation protein YtxC [Heliorestis acidaminivorans]